MTKTTAMFIVCLASIGCSGKGQLRFLDNSNSSPSTEIRDSDLNPEASKSISILSKNCASCHGQPNQGPGGFYDVLNLDHLVDLGMLVAGSSATSPLVQLIERGVMPPTGALPSADVVTLRDWVDAGMPMKKLGPTPTPLPRLAPNFESIYANILGPKCVGCHGASLTSGGVRLDTYENALMQVDLLQPANSKIYIKTESGAMPPSPATPLTNIELLVIRQWIQDGAAIN